MSLIDLHAHTTFSDGTCTPSELVREAVRAGLGALAVTDHDTTEGLEEARSAASEVGIELIDGVEISTRHEAKSVHVLAYGFDPEHEGLQALLHDARHARRRRNEAMVERLNELGVPVTLSAIRRQAGGEIIGRPHFARALVEAGHVESLGDAYTRWIGQDAPAFVLTQRHSPREAVSIVRAAGGVSVIAHAGKMALPTTRAYERFFEELVEAGLTGIEVDHPAHGPERRQELTTIAQALDLVPTGGSDFHGANKPRFALGRGDGTIRVPYETWERLRARTAVAG